MAAGEVIDRRSQEFVEAWARSDAATLDRLLADRYRHTDIDGRVWNRSAWLRYASEPRPVSAVTSEDVDVEVHGDLAVVTGRNLITFGQSDGSLTTGIHALRFTQLWILENGDWKRAYFQATLERPPDPSLNEP